MAPPSSLAKELGVSKDTVRRARGDATCANAEPDKRVGINGSGYFVRDANGQALAYLYSRDNDAEARQAKVLTRDEARRIAMNFARLPELLGKGERD
jgi:hypothetical protein